MSHPSCVNIVRRILTLAIVSVLTVGASATTAVQIDVKPGVCKNAVNPLATTGHLKVAILGSSTFNVANVDLTTIRLHVVDGFGTLGAQLAGTASIGSIAPLPKLTKSLVLSGLAVEDVLGNCTSVTNNGTDLLLQFSLPAVVQALGLGSLPSGTTVPLGITGSLIGGGDFSSLNSPDYINLQIVGVPAANVVPSGSFTKVAPNDFVITAPNHIHLKGKISSTATFSSQWFHQGGLVTGVGEVSFSAPTSPITDAIFNTAGQYLLRFTASTATGTTQRIVRVTVNLNPNALMDPTLAIGPVLALTDPSAQPNDFLTYGADGVLSNVTDSTTADAYYQAIDPGNQKTFFGDWLTRNGINLGDPTTYTLAGYFNAIDLGFGRRMIVSKDGTAWVVTNHRTVDDAVNDVNPIAAVAMEFQPDATTGNTFTKFYIYDRGQQVVNPATGQLDNPRVNKADLDGGGAKYLPGLCIVCHGGKNPANVSPGQPYPNPGGNVHAHFLPFDLDALQYSSNPQFTRDAQQDTFRQLNQSVLNIQTKNPDYNNNLLLTLIELVEGWYGQAFNQNGATLTGTQNTNFVASGWAADPPRGQTVPANVYSGVIARSCRNCHSTRPSPYDFSSNNTSPTIMSPFIFGNVDLTQSHITTPPIGTPAIMPHIRRTQQRFWLNTSAKPEATPPAPPEADMLRRFFCDFSNATCQ